MQVVALRCNNGGVARRRNKRMFCTRCGVVAKRLVNGLPIRLCDDCLGQALAGWSDHTSSRGWESRMKTKYGITPDEHACRYLDQHGLCAICGDPERSERKTDGTGGLVVDHNHDTGAVRGLLCGRCNSAIGLLADNIEWLHSAIWYLRLTDGCDEGTLERMESRDKKKGRVLRYGRRSAWLDDAG